MTDEELMGTEEEELLEAEATEEIQPEDDGGIEVVEDARFDVRVFFHTGAAATLKVDEDDSVYDLRKALEKEGRRTHGNVVLLNGRQISPDYEAEQYLSPGDIVTFSGSVKGG